MAAPPPPPPQAGATPYQAGSGSNTQMAAPTQASLTPQQIQQMASVNAYNGNMQNPLWGEMTWLEPNGGKRTPMPTPNYNISGMSQAQQVQYQQDYLNSLQKNVAFAGSLEGKKAIRNAQQQLSNLQSANPNAKAALDPGTGYQVGSQQEQAYNQQQQMTQRLNDLMNQLNTPPDFNSPYYQNILNNVQNRASSAASNAGIQGGMATSNVAGQLNNAEANLTMDRQNQYMQALGMGTQQSNFEQSFGLQQQTQDQNYKLQSTQLQAQLDAAQRQQDLGMLGIFGSLAGGTAGAMGSMITGNPQLASAGAQAGNAAAQGIGSSSMPSSVPTISNY